MCDGMLFVRAFDLFCQSSLFSSGTAAAAADSTKRSSTLRILKDFCFFCLNRKCSAVCMRKWILEEERECPSRSFVEGPCWAIFWNIPETVILILMEFGGPARAQVSVDRECRVVPC